MVGLLWEHEGGLGGGRGGCGVLFQRLVSHKTVVTAGGRRRDGLGSLGILQLGCSQVDCCISLISRKEGRDSPRRSGRSTKHRRLSERGSVR